MGISMTASNRLNALREARIACDELRDEIDEILEDQDVSDLSFLERLEDKQTRLNAELSQLEET